jgi:multidrug efflux pump
MNISEPFIKRPVATSLITTAVLLGGAVAYVLLPVAPLPQIEYPTVQVSAGLPGASPETMASAVTTPLERQFGKIAGVTEMTSTSSLGSCQITLQFDLDRNIDAAARDVQAAINASAGQLPAGLPTKPNYRKTNPSDQPVQGLVLTSEVLPTSRLYDLVDSIIGQKLAQIKGVGLVSIGGSSRPAVRIELNPMVLAKYGIGLEAVRTALAQANSNMPTGSVDNGIARWTVSDDNQLFDAAHYRPIIVAYNKGAPVRLADIASVQDSVENIYNDAIIEGRHGILVPVFRQPGANIMETVDRIRAAMPYVNSAIPPSVELSVGSDRTYTIRASFKDIKITLLITISLVILVIFCFLRNIRATMIPAVAVPVSLVGTFGVMYLLGYSLDNLSLMAITISTGFVVDDAIVVIENVTRYQEAGMSPMEAALKGSQEIGFTVLTMSTSLIAVFIPLLMMSGIVGRLFREFAVTLSVAILVSLGVSLTTTPMMCAKFLKADHGQKHNAIYRFNERAFEKLSSAYARGLEWVLRHQPLTLGILIATVCLNIFLFVIVPKGFFPQQDTGLINGSIQGSQDISFDAMKQKSQQFNAIVAADPAVQIASSTLGGGTVSRGNMTIGLKPLAVRKVSSDQVIQRLRRKLNAVAGATLFLQTQQDIRIGGRQSNSQYQFTLESENLNDLYSWAPRMLEKLRTVPELKDVNSDQQMTGLETQLVIDHDTASRLGISTQEIDNTLYDAFGQRQVSTVYTQMNEYHLVMEVNQQYQENPDALKNIYVKSSTGMEVPLSAFAHLENLSTPLQVNHQGQFPAVTLSFDIDPGTSLGSAVDATLKAAQEMDLPASIHASFAGTAEAFQDSLKNEWILILSALGAVYIVLGMLYESLIHPITILSTLPSAGVGAILALLLCRTDLSLIAMIGIILLIGLVKKNAILMIDFALDAERKEGLSPRDAIYKASLLRFRPIMMTTMAALFGALPLALGTGTGSEMRRPLGISIVGGLIVSQMLTLFTTPVVYLYMDRLREALSRRKVPSRVHLHPSPSISGGPLESFRSPTSAD